MHSALFIVELLFRIFGDPILASRPISKYTAEQEHYLRRHPLLSLALTCKTFSPVALHVLWREIDGIDQLLWTMSDDIIKFTLSVEDEENGDSGSESSSSFDSSESEFHRKCMAFKKRPVEQDWEPFDRYGTLVTRLNNRNRSASGDTLELSPNVLEALNGRYDLKGTSLLPNLQFLTCQGWQLRYAHTLLGPRLHSLSIPNTVYYDLSYDLQAFLQVARLNPPTRLKILELYGIRNQELDKEVGELFSEFVISIQQNGEGLHRVCTDTLSWFSLGALNLVLTNERIQAVRIDVEQFDLNCVLPLATSGVREDLHTVMIYAEKGLTSNSLQGQSFFHEFFRRLNARNLVSFTFMCGPRYLSVQDARAIFTFLHYENPFAEFDTDQNAIRIFSADSAEPLDGIMTDSAHHICTFANSFYLACQPMSSTDPTPRFAYLQNLQLHVRVDFTDSDIGSLSSSMPRLTFFNVETRRAGRTGRSRTTLIGIWFLAKNCRDIESVGIWFNAVLDWEQFAGITQVDMASVNDEEGRRTALQEAMNINLLSLTVGDSNIGDTDVVTEFFNEVCPCLQDINSIGEEDWEKWEAVQEFLADESYGPSSSYASSDYRYSDSSDDDWG